MKILKDFKQGSKILIVFGPRVRRLSDSPTVQVVTTEMRNL